MMINYYDTHSNVRYGTIPSSLYDRILYKLEAIENDWEAKRNVSAIETFINHCYEIGELARDEYVDLISIIERFAVDEQLSKYIRTERKSPVMPPNQSQRVKKCEEVINNIDRNM